LASSWMKRAAHSWMRVPTRPWRSDISL
jgi:hypothetical protein